MISSVSRKKILDIIFSVEESFKFANSNEGIIPFLNEIWNLESMPSEDNRFKNAEQDIIQHVNTPFLTQHHCRIIKPPVCTQQVSYH